jgi:DNA-binding CsgD family transcriptional regulator
MSHPDTARTLHGRRSEQELLDHLVTGARRGRGGALVLWGEEGVGKTALLDYLESRGKGCRILRVEGVDSEAELDFAGLQRLCETLSERAEGLPAPQRDALGAAFGLQGRADPDRFLVGMAVHGVFAAVADEQPLVCIVDDVDSLDRGSVATLAFVARRVSADPIVVVLAGRGARTADLAALPVLELGGLADDDAGALLESGVCGRLDEAVRDRLLAEARGNPCAVLEGIRAAPDKLAGGFGLDASSLPASTVERWRCRLAELPASTQHLLVLAAAEPTGDPLVFWRAAAELGLGPDAATPATAVGLHVGQRVLFRRPLDRAAVYRSASSEERKRVHAALAAATDAELDPDRRAWHRACATSGLDESVAAELEQAAERARSRGGLAAEAAFLDHAATLSPDAACRGRRALAAAQAKQLAGAPDEAARLLAIADAGPLGELDRARAELVRARIECWSTLDHEHPWPLPEAAKRLPEVEGRLASSAYADALFAALSRRCGDAGRIAGAVLSAGEDLEGDLLLGGLAHLVRGNYAVAAPALAQAVDRVRAEPLPGEDAFVRLWLAGYAARALGDVAAWDDLTRRHVELTRTAGALALLPIALGERARLELARGNLGVVRGLVVEAEATLAATGGRVGIDAPALLAAWEVDEGPRPVAEHPDEAVLSPWGSIDLIEAAVRSGSPEDAAEPLRRLNQLAPASGTEWARAAESAARALVSRGEGAQRHYCRAIERIEAAGVPFFHARMHLLYGEWLRRDNRRLDARRHLRLAHEMLEAMGARGYAERAGRELLATGATARKRIDATRDDLTAQEVQIARLAAAGHTNPEIGARLFLSPRTVEWHLRKVYPKLGVRGRRELGRALPQAS